MENFYTIRENYGNLGLWLAIGIIAVGCIAVGFLQQGILISFCFGMLLGYFSPPLAAGLIDLFRPNR